MPAMSDKTYDILKWLVLIVIPSLTTFYCICDGVFGWGYSDIVSKISAGFCACLGDHSDLGFLYSTTLFVSLFGLFNDKFI